MPWRILVLDRVLVSLVVLVAIALRVGLTFVVPPWQGPDEPRHFDYVRLLVDKRDQLWRERRFLELEDRSPELQAEIIESMMRNRFWQYANRPVPDPPPRFLEEVWRLPYPYVQYKQTYSPYHWLLAAALLPFQTADVDQQLHVVRICSAILSGLTAGVTYLAARQVAPDDRFVPIASAGFVATLPMHAFIGATVNTDNLVTLGGALVVLVLSRGLRGSFTVRRSVAVAGLLLLAILAKRAAVSLLPAVLVAVVASANMVRRRAARWSIIAGTLLVLLLGFLLLTGTPPLDRAREALIFYFLNEPDQIDRAIRNVQSALESPDVVAMQMREMFRGFWGYFGWYRFPIDDALVDALLVMTTVILVGLVARPRRSEGAEHDRHQGVIISVSLVAVLSLLLLAIGERLAYFSPTEVPQGRYLFVAITPIAILATLGLRALLPRSILGTLAPTCAVLVGLIALDYVVLGHYLLPAYLEAPIGLD